VSQARPIASEIEAHARSLHSIGLILLVLGGLAILAPMVAGIAIALMVGVLVLASGCARLAFALRAGSFGRGILGTVLGTLGVVCGVLMMAHPILGLAFLTLLLAAYFVVTGIFEIAYAIRLRPVTGWIWMLFSGVTALVLGVLIELQWPLSGAWAVGVLVGIQMVFAGSSLMAVTRSAKRASSPGRPETP
jgi:uncharacterized membrane protein HdeD (DUF308 family)